MNFSELLKEEFLIKRNLTITELSDLVNVDTSLLSRYLSGKIKPTVKTIKKFEKAFKFSLTNYYYTDSNSLGTMLKNILINRNITQKSLANQLDISEGALSSYLNGTHQPSIRTIKMLKEKLEEIFPDINKEVDFQNSTNAFGVMLHYLLDINLLTQSEFAKIFNVSEGIISLYINGKLTPSLAQLKKMEIFFDISLERFYPKLSAPTPFGKELQKIMFEKSFSQKDLAAFLGLRANSVSKYLTESITPNLNTLMHIEKFSGLDFSQFYPKSEKYSPLGQKIIYELSKRKISKKDFAKLAGITCATIQNYLTGKTNPSKSNLKIIESVLNVSLSN